MKGPTPEAPMALPPQGGAAADRKDRPTPERYALPLYL